MNDERKRKVAGTSTGIGMTGIEALQISFIILKLCHVINWSWIWVFAPLWMSILLTLLIIIAIIVIAVIMSKL